CRDALQACETRIRPLFDEGARGGEAEKLYWLTARVAETNGLIAAQDNDRASEIAAWQSAATQAKLASDATKAAWDAEVCTAAAPVKAINFSASTRQRYAALTNDESAHAVAQRDQEHKLFDMSRMHYSLFCCSSMGLAPDRLLYPIAHYVLARCSTNHDE